MKDTNEVLSDLLHDFPDWLQEFREVWSVNVVLQSHVETLSLDIETLPVVIMHYHGSREQTVEPGSGEHCCLRALSKGPKIVISA